MIHWLDTHWQWVVWGIVVIIFVYAMITPWGDDPMGGP